MKSRTDALQRDALRERYHRVRAATLRLTEPLTPEDCVAQSMTEASPIHWQLAHTTWFFETFVLQPAGSAPFHPQFGFLFNSYYDAVGERVARERRGLMTRPGLAEIERYRRHVDAEIERLFVEAPARLPRELLMLGTHHEEQHQELMLTDLKHLFAQNPLRPVYRERESGVGRDTGPQRFAPFPEGVRAIGHAGAGFAFDNEGPRHKAFVAAFELAERPVTNAEYLEFMADGGYSRPEPWLSDGWARVQAHGWQAPLYWEQRDGRWQTFTLSGMRPVEPYEPVCHVSYYEADAYARWAGARLATEAEWEVAAEPLAPEGHFCDEAHLHPRPTPAGTGLRALYGDVWEWTASPYTPYPGFRPAAGAVGEYNGKFMSNQMVLRGGSCVSPPGHLRASYRNFFPPEARWQFSGIRLAR